MISKLWNNLSRDLFVIIDDIFFYFSKKMERRKKRILAKNF